MSNVIDTGGDEWLDGLSYASQEAHIDDGSSLSASVTRVGASGVEVVVPGVGSWRMDHGHRVALDRTLRRGPRPWPPPEAVLAVGGSGRTQDARRGLAVGDRLIDEVVESARGARVVVLEADVPRAAPLAVQLAAAGIVCAASGPIPGIGPRLAEALAVDPEAVAADEVVWAGALASQSRAVWLDHDLHLRWREGADGWSPVIAVPPAPSVSVVLASKRPAMVPAALARIAAQETIDPEVVVALHGAGDPSAVEGEMRRLGLTGHALLVPVDVPLGGALDAAVDQASGEYITKWDDDDLYGRHHLADLVVASRRSGAALIGKRAEFIHFVRTGDTVFRTPKGAEDDARNIAGATLFTSREALRAAGGFAPLPKSVDYHLRRRYLALGLRIHRTHGFGFVLVRGDDHTWQIDDDRLRTKVVRTYEGVPDLSDVLA